MTRSDIIRAWKNPEFRHALDGETLATLPSNPAGLIELNDEELARAAGLSLGAQTTAMTCTEYSFRGWRKCCP